MTINTRLTSFQARPSTLSAGALEADRPPYADTRQPPRIAHNNATQTTTAAVAKPDSDQVLVDDGNLKMRKVVQDGATTVLLETGQRSDSLLVAPGTTGRLEAIVNGKAYGLPELEGEDDELIISTMGGNDHIKVDPRVKHRIDISAGDGNDFIKAGAGPTLVSGGKGDDYILMGDGNGRARGGDGADILVGGQGDVELHGGKGNDRLYAGWSTQHKASYLYGGEGDDQLYAARGKSVLHGEQGKDTLVGYRDTTFYTGRGAPDVVHSYDANDRIYGKPTDKLHNHANASLVMVQQKEVGKRGIEIHGDDRFVEIIEGYLEQLRSSPAGQKMLEEMDRLADRHGSPVTIENTPYTGMDFFLPRNAASDKLPWSDPEEKQNVGFLKDGAPGSLSTHGHIFLDPDYVADKGGDAHLITLFHEMIHAYHGAQGTHQKGTVAVLDNDGKPVITDHGTLTEGLHELQTIGLPNTGTPYDFDNDPRTPPTTVAPYPFYENALRQEMGVPLRTRYTPVA